METIESRIAKTYKILAYAQGTLSVRKGSNARDALDRVATEKNIPIADLAIVAGARRRWATEGHKLYVIMRSEYVQQRCPFAGVTWI